MHVPAALSAWRNLYEDRLNFRFVCLRILKFLAASCGSGFENRRDFWSLLCGRARHEYKHYETDQQRFHVVLPKGLGYRGIDGLSIPLKIIARAYYTLPLWWSCRPRLDGIPGGGPRCPC